MYKIIICSIFALLMTGCSFFQVHKPEIEQGNIITSASVDHLHTGMSQSQVRFVMGEPVLSHPFSPNRVEYVYTYQLGSAPRKEERVTCLFEQGKLKEVIR